MIYNGKTGVTMGLKNLQRQCRKIGDNWHGSMTLRINKTTDIYDKALFPNETECSVKRGIIPGVGERPWSKIVLITAAETRILLQYLTTLTETANQFCHEDQWFCIIRSAGALSILLLIVFGFTVSLKLHYYARMDCLLC